jgi:ATP-dependent DNA ligase
MMLPPSMPRRARCDDEVLAYAGKVENGFDDDSRRDLLRRTDPLKTKVQPLAEKITTRGHVDNV